MDILSYLLGFKKGKSMGGGSSADVRYVTFVGADGTVLYKKAVAVGDDCVDVAAKGLISTPTKEMTDAEVYTYSGWSLISGGAASSSALTNVTEDRTVYAAFTTSAIKCTVRFLNGDTVLQTSTVAYGEIPVYTGAEPTPEQDYAFVGWTPTIDVVTGDVDYVAKFVFTKSVTRALVDRSITEYSDETLTDIGRSAFMGCGALVSVNIPSVTNIGRAAFQACSFINEVHLPATPPTLYNADVFASIDRACVFYVPTGSLAAYQAAQYWSTLMNTYSFVEEDR